jgi:two-component system, response regulator PdtaR
MVVVRGTSQQTCRFDRCRRNVLAKVLVVEDEPLIIIWVEDALLDAGYEVATACDADAAIKVLETDSSINVLFTDIDMPGSMDGLRLAAAVIIASGKHRPAVSEMPEHAVFLAKPYLSIDMLGAVDRAARAH